MESVNAGTLILRPYGSLSVRVGITPIEIDERPDDASGFRKLAAGRIDAVYSNRDRGRQIIGEEGLAEGVRYAGFVRSFDDQALLDRFDAAWRALFLGGAAQKIIEGHGLEPAEVD